MIKPAGKAKPYQVRQVPELPGCMSDGADRAEALKNVEEIISEWIETARLEGRQIPEPKGRLIYA